MRSTAQFDIQIAYSDVVDVAAESERLRKEIERLQKDIASKERQLGDETFRSRAPQKIIQGMQATLEERRIELGKSSERLQQLERGA
jgi:valyl-tRNA synthetase